MTARTKKGKFAGIEFAIFGITRPNMILDVKENAVCILVEKSHRTEAFLPAVKELLVGVLSEKCNQENSSERFRFNIAYFDREPTFWADQVTECTTNNANNAAHWIRSWTNLAASDNDLHHAGPHTMMALVAAFNDPFAGAVYLLTASAPIENANDLINHVKFASKDRPVHVIFLTSRSRIDDKAMELLHSVSRKTEGGTFRAAYYDDRGPATGRLIEVPALSRQRPRLLFANNSAETSFSVSPSSTMAQSPVDTIHSPIFVDTRDSTHSHRLRQSTSGESFRDLIIKTPKSMHSQPSLIGRDIIINTGRSNAKHALARSLFDDTQFSEVNNDDHQFFRIESTAADASHESVDSISSRSSEMEEIKKEFVELYHTKQNHKGKRGDHEKIYDPPRSKSVEFDALVTDRKRPVSPPTPISSLSSSESEDESVGKYNPKRKIEKRAAPKNRASPDIDLESGFLGGTPISEHRLSSSRPSTGRNIRAPMTTIYSKSHFSPITPKSFSTPHTFGHSPLVSSRSSAPKPAWRPPTAKRHFVGTTPKTANNAQQQPEDRSRAWMNRWMNDWVKRHEPQHRPTRTHAAIQADFDKEATALAMHRSKSEPRKLQMNTYTQTPHEEKRIDDEIHTIRELLTHNNNLLGAITRTNHSVQNHAKKLTPRRSISHDFEKLTLGDHRLRDQRLIERGASLGLGPNSTRDHGHQTRRDLLQNALDRKEEIRKQQQQANYKAMYQKLAHDVGRNDNSERRFPVRHVITNGDEKMELIARLPNHARGIFQG